MAQAVPEESQEKVPRAEDWDRSDNGTVGDGKSSKDVGARQHCKRPSGHVPSTPRRSHSPEREVLQSPLVPLAQLVQQPPPPPPTPTFLPMPPNTCSSFLSVLLVARESTSPSAQIQIRMVWEVVAVDGWIS